MLSSLGSRCTGQVGPQKPAASCRPQGLWEGDPRVLLGKAVHSAHLSNAGAREGHDHGHHVDRQLELQELGDAVVDVAAPHDRLDDAGEVVISQDDV